MPPGRATSRSPMSSVATGQVITSVHRRHRAVEFKKFLAKLDNEVPADLNVHLICEQHPQTPHREALARRASPVPHALHPHLLVLAQPGRTVVRAADRHATAPRHARLPTGTGERPTRLDRSMERRPQTVHLDQDRRRDPRPARLISSTNSRRRTPARVSSSRESPHSEHVTCSGDAPFPPRSERRVQQQAAPCSRSGGWRTSSLSAEPGSSPIFQRRGFRRRSHFLSGLQGACHRS